MIQPFISIVIANYNYGRFLEEAIESVVSQNMGDKVELIICDAASTDNSVDLIKKYANGLPPNTSYYDWTKSDPSLTTNDQQLTTKITWWCSEPDGGQSAAFNKGFSHARGRFLTWLNADDVLLPGTIERLKSAAEKHRDCEWFVGGCFWLDPEMRIINCGRGRRFSKIRYMEGNVSVWGPSSFFTKRLFDSVGGIDERFHFAMDSDLWLRFAHLAKARYVPFCNYAWGLRLHPAAKMSGHNFTDDGKYDSKSTEADKIKRNKHIAQIRQEAKWKAGYFHAKRSTFLSRIISMDFFQVVCAKVDLLRMRGKHYMECYK